MHIDLLLMEEKNKKHYVLIIKDFNTFMYDHTLHLGKNTFVDIVCKLLTGRKY